MTEPVSNTPAHGDVLPVRYWIGLAVAGPIVLLLGCNWIPTRTIPGHVRYLYDPHEIAVYHSTSDWAVGDGVIYRNIISDYPPVANVLFAAVRLMSDTITPFSSGYRNFAWVWLSFTWLVYLGVVRITANELPRQALWLWLNPVTLYFTLLRFDIFPAALSMMALLAARREDYLTAGRMLGFAIAVKGYALWMVPAFAVFVLQRAGFRRAFVVTALCVGPMILASLAVWVCVGWDGMMMPYKLQASRKLDSSESTTYDVLNKTFGVTSALEIDDHPGLARGIQLAAALLAAALLPRRFPELCDAALIGVVGLISASVFFSPQFILWLLPLAACSDSRYVRGIVLLMLPATYLFFPVAYDLKNGALSQSTTTVLCLLRFMLLGVCLTRLVKSRFRTTPDPNTT